MTRFRVCGTREVLGHAPGEEFDAEISDIQEWRLTVGGHIERVVGEGDWTAPDQQPDVRAGDEHEKE